MALLVVDDQNFIRGFVCQMLQTLGCNYISIATNGSAAVKHLDGADTDLILLDIHMKVMNGLGSARCHKSGRYPGQTIFTGHYVNRRYGPDQLAFAAKLKANAIIAKPLSLDTLTKAIGQVFSTLRPYRPLPLNLEAIEERIKMAEIINTDPETHSLDYIYKPEPANSTAIQ